MFAGSDIVMLSHILGFATGSNPSARIPPTQQEDHKCTLVTRQVMLRPMCLDAPLFTPFAWLSHLAVLSVAGKVVATLTLMYSYLTVHRDRGRKSLTCPVYAVRTEWLMLRADEADQAGDAWPVDTGSGRGGRCRRRRSQPGDSSLSSVADKEPGLSSAARSPTSAASLPVVCPAAAVA